MLIILLYVIRPEIDLFWSFSEKKTELRMERRTVGLALHG